MINKSNGKMGYNEGTYLRSSVVVVTESKRRVGEILLQSADDQTSFRERERDVEKSNGQNSN